MNLTKKDWALLGTVTAILFILLNIASFYIIKKQLSVSIYDSDNYIKAKSVYRKKINNGSVPHPYFGMAPAGDEHFKSSLADEPLFHSVSNSKSANPIKVLVLGGSVASHLSQSGGVAEEHLLANMLNNHYHTDRFVVYNAAFGGGKQPQQYFKYLYLDLVGFRPNLVINIDGYNEVALTLAENEPLQNPAIFPRSYSRLLHASTSDRSCALTSNKLIEIDTNVPLVEFLSLIYIRHCHYRIEGAPTDIPWWANAFGGARPESFIPETVAIWEASSNKLDYFTRQKKIKYIHVLQPNQYVDNSKSFSNEEEKFLLNNSYGTMIKKYYSMLGPANITSRNFYDQRYIFKDVNETVYTDDCCHFNQKGMEIMINNLIKRGDVVFKELLKN